MKKKINKGSVRGWFFFNPLFFLYADRPEFIEALKDPNQKQYYYYDIDGEELDPFDYDQRQMDSRDTNEIERQIVNYESANQLRKRFKENETFGYLLNLFKDGEKLPIALITFVFSVFLATDTELRQTFYSFYPGQKVPAITQFCFSVFRQSPISDNEWITDFHFIDNEYQATVCCCGLGNTFADKTSLKEDPEDIVAWFSLWEEHFNLNEKPYLEWVEFKRVPCVSTDKNYLCGLTIENQGVTWSENGYFNELSDDKKNVYTMLARVLDRVCVPENTVLPVPHKDILSRTFDEKEMVARLIGFIVSESKRFLA